MAEETPEPDLLASIESGTADRRILEFAARGFVPLSPGDLVRAVAAIAASGDAELSALADETFKTLEAPAILDAVRSAGIRPDQLDAIARHADDPKILEPLIRSRSVSNETLAWLADRIPPELQDILITNQTRLLAAPAIIERLFENPNLSTDIRRRADEFLEEFFLKRIREEAAAATLAEEAAEAEAVAAAAEAARKEAASPIDGFDEDSADDLSKSLFARVSQMTIVQRIRLAYIGNREERMFLIRDRNRLVSTAVLKSPKTNEADAESIANMKSVSEDVLRGVSFRREWMKKYSIVLSLVKNPRSPIDMSLPLVNRLQERDQKALAGDRNVPEPVRVFARRAVSRRQSK